MEHKLKKLKKEFLEKQQHLSNAKKVLKSEFFGINSIIDDIIDNVRTWYLIPEIQDKPLIINLWGLTGVGKTSLVKRLAELIHFQDKFFRFDLGEKEGKYSFQESLEDLCGNSDESPVIIALDEFQHARTIEGPMRREANNLRNRTVWELVDSGKVQYLDWNGGLWGYEVYLKKLISLVKGGVKVKNGFVTLGKKIYREEFQIQENDNKELRFVSESYYEDIINLAGDKLGLKLIRDVRKVLMNFSETETIVFLNKVAKYGKRPSVKSFEKALIFVLGNLDEAYTMSSNFSADIDADEFYKQSLKITIPNIKNALQKRFRAEQIARLGNIHIIYPALDKKSYYRIIRHELHNYSKEIKKLTGINIEFNDSVVEMVYSEGVYPTQGARPIFTSIHYLIKSKIPLFLSEILSGENETNLIKFSITNQHLKGEFYAVDEIIFSKKIKLKTPLGDIRKNSYDDQQAITAVHESGHTVLSVLLLNIIPQIVYSVTSDSDNLGFVFARNEKKYFSRSEMIPRTAFMLGGYMAEQVVFGKKNLTTGASSDIEKATEFLSKMLKEHGMGDIPIRYSLAENKQNFFYHNHFQIEEEIKTILTEAQDLAYQVLTREKQLLLTMSNYLSDNRMLRNSDIETMINNHSTGNKPANSHQPFAYRTFLKQALKGMQNNDKVFDVVMLNREEKNFE